MTQLYFYSVFGLVVASELVLPELVAVAATEEPDVTIVRQPVPESLEGDVYKSLHFEVAGDVCLCSISGIARYRVEQGCRISVDTDVSPVPGREVTEGDVRLYLLSYGLGSLLHQRHWLPLHISALATPSGVWAFTGASGAGKSTLAAWLHYSQGWPLVSDDAAVLKPEDDLPYLYLGPPRLKLWQDALAALGIDKQGLIQDQTRTDKYHLCLHQKFQSQPVPLKALVLLERAPSEEPATLQRLMGAESFQAMMAALYGHELGMRVNGPESLMSLSARLGNQIAVYRYRRPWDLANLEANLQPLLSQIAELSEGPEGEMPKTTTAKRGLAKSGFR